MPRQPERAGAHTTAVCNCVISREMQAKRNGEIQVVVGPMFSGKTTELLRRLHRYHLAQRRVVAVKSMHDTRYTQEPIIQTHGQQQWTRTVVASQLTDVQVDADVIGVDEGQFYPDLVEVCERWANAGIIVVVAMLDGTYAREPFPDHSLARLMARAESITKLTAVCSCGADAAFTMLTTQEHGDDTGRLVGGSERYKAACRACHGINSLQ